MKQEDLKWRRLSGQPARTIKEVPLITITSEGTFVYDPENGGFFSKLSKRQMEKVEVMWKKLPCPPCEPDCVHYVDRYFYFIEVLEGSPEVVARAQEGYLPSLDENAVALIKTMKANRGGRRRKS